MQIDIEGPYPVMPGDVYVLCSDGLTGHVQDAEIGIIARELPPQEACRLLVNLANLRGGSDNVTVVAVHVGGGPAGAEPEEEPPAPSRGLGWGWLITVWLLALLFVVGVTSILFNKFLEGVYLVAAAAFSAVGAFAYWLEKRPRRKPPAPDLDGTETTIWKPYRTASARSSVAFLNHLASLQVELQRAATEEHWSIDWPAYEVAYAAARASLEAHQVLKGARRTGACSRNLDDGPDAIPQAAPSPVKMGQTPEPAGREIGRMRAEERGQGSGDRGQRRQRRIPIDSNCATSDIRILFPDP